MENLLALLTSPGLQLVVAGALGGIARWLIVIIADSKLAPRQAAAMTALGGIVGFYASPPFEPALGGVLERLGFITDPEKLPAFSAFATGSVAIGVMGLIVDNWFNRKKPSQELPVAPLPPHNEAGP